MPNLKAQSQLVCFIKPNYSQHCTQSGVSISTNVFEVYMLEVNRRNYNSFIVIYIKWLRQSC